MMNLEHGEMANIFPPVQLLAAGIRSDDAADAVLLLLSDDLKIHHCALVFLFARKQSTWNDMLEFIHAKQRESRNGWFLVIFNIKTRTT